MSISSTGSGPSVGTNSHNAFITEIDSMVKKPLIDEQLFEPVRKEHSKIRDVVNAFNAKVELLVEKQRFEYIQAYENHMQDVQKELYALRAKVAEIANDDTKNEKMRQLKRDQIRYKDETLRFETDIEELRKTMRSQVETTYSVGKSVVNNPLRLLFCWLLCLFGLPFYRDCINAKDSYRIELNVF